LRRCAFGILIPSGGLRGVRVKGGKTRDIPLPSAVTAFLAAYVERRLRKEAEDVDVIRVRGTF